jgi:subtilisin family serine protease
LLAQSSGYLKLASSSPVCAYEIFGSYNSAFFASVPAQRAIVGNTIAPALADQVVLDPLNNIAFVANEIVILFKQETSDNEINQIAATVNGTIVGAIPDINAIQVRIAPLTSMAAFAALKSSLMQYASVRSVSPNIVISNDQARFEATNADPNDYHAWKNSLYSFPAISLPDAWANFTTGKNTVAIGVVDGGFVENHEDLQNIHITANSRLTAHGTHVAGIVGAKGNNWIGTAGVMWDSTILAAGAGFDVFCDSGKVVDCKRVNGLMAQLYTSMAAMGGARIVNLSIGTVAPGLAEKILLSAPWAAIFDLYKDTLFVIV